MLTRHRLGAWDSPGIPKSVSQDAPPAEIFQFEEANSEAIIDTGASKAVAGSERSQGLIDSCDVFKMESSGPPPVSHSDLEIPGTLRSTFAVFFPRKTNCWIRVEVVPGRTPFLLSNSMLSSLRAVVDIESKRLWFKGSQGSIPLKTCRKNLLCVEFSKLLNMDVDDTCGDHQEIHVTTTKHETETDSCRVQIGLSPMGKKGNDTEGTDHVRGWETTKTWEKPTPIMLIQMYRVFRASQPSQL